MKYSLTYSEHPFLMYEGCTQDHEHSWCEQESYGLSVTLGTLHRTPPSARMGYEEINSERALYGVEDVPVGEVAHLVVCEYIDGDTFGHNGYWCVAGLFGSPEAADACRAKCEGQNDTERAYRPWDGYFASLQEARVEPLTVLA